MTLDVLVDADAAAVRAAEVIAAEARSAVQERGRFVLAVSGGRSPWIMLRALSGMDVPWGAVHLLQVDERVAPEGHADRNLTHLRESLLDRVPLPPEHVHAMPVAAGTPEAAAAAYADVLRHVAGSPPALDLAHLGLGPDGHTASLVPGDPVLGVSEDDVAAAGVYQGRRRVTLTYPVLNRARRLLWLVTGADKAAMLPRLLAADAAIPAGRVSQARATVIADRAAATAEA